jgi:hypothetical protein
VRNAITITMRATGYPLAPREAPALCPPKKARLSSESGTRNVLPSRPNRVSPRHA